VPEGKTEDDNVRSFVVGAFAGSSLIIEPKDHCCILAKANGMLDFMKRR